MKTAIIGGGACGLLLAALLDKAGLSYTVFNRGKLGRKILSSGNGRCNIGNVFLNENCYHTNPLAKEIVSSQQSAFFKTLEELKIYTKKDLEGRLYPISESSLSVLNAILKHIHGPVVDCEIHTIEKRAGTYVLNDRYSGFDKVVIATGSIANFKPPYPSVPRLLGIPLSFHAFRPALVGFTTNLDLRAISGVRKKCLVSLFQGNRRIGKELGEVIFKDNGISGICVMNLSGSYMHLETQRDCRLVLDLADKSYDDYTTVLPPKLLDYINKTGADIHSFVLPITGVYDFEFAQVCRGGIAVEELNPNLSLVKNPDIFAGGEVIDVDGVCGGYNLMFAFCCAITICEELKHEISD